MKVNSPLSPFFPAQATQSSDFKHNDPNDWIALLALEKRPQDAPEKHTDEYYWQHQHQLEPSELTFHPVVHNSTSSHHSTQAKMEKAPTLSSVNTVTSVPSACGSVPSKEALTKAIKTLGSVDNSSSKALRPAACPRDPELLLNVQSSCTEIVRTGSSGQAARRRELNGQQTLQTPTSTFKHYQLFIDDKQVELTLNTSHWSKHPIIELKAFIHQWFNQKGYTLKKLILNGEQQ